MRDRLGLMPGDEVAFAMDDDSVRVEPVRSESSLRGTLEGLELVAALEADRRSERDR
jgi:bifunctional DNA-binding transcriptional regulator/antitoxin component of YhaV-PrlF toxin-antitoxin module